MAITDGTFDVAWVEGEAVTTADTGDMSTWFEGQPYVVYESSEVAAPALFFGTDF